MLPSLSIQTSTLTDVSTFEYNILQSNEDEMATHLPIVEKIKLVGEELIQSDNFGSEKIRERVNEMDELWSALEKIASIRKSNLNAALNYNQVNPIMLDRYTISKSFISKVPVFVNQSILSLQFFTDADDVNTYLYDTCRIVSNDNLGHDESSVLSLIKKHKDVTDALSNYSTVISALSQQADQLDSSVCFLTLITTLILHLFYIVHQQSLQSYKRTLFTT